MCFIIVRGKERSWFERQCTQFLSENFLPTKKRPPLREGENRSRFVRIKRSRTPEKRCRKYWSSIVVSWENSCFEARTRRKILKKNEGENLKRGRSTHASATDRPALEVRLAEWGTGKSEISRRRKKLKVRMRAGRGAHKRSGSGECRWRAKSQSCASFFVSFFFCFFHRTWFFGFALLLHLDHCLMESQRAKLPGFGPARIC
jgi:hypothetical protein